MGHDGVLGGRQGPPVLNEARTLRNFVIEGARRCVGFMREPIDACTSFRRSVGGDMVDQGAADASATALRGDEQILEVAGVGNGPVGAMIDPVHKADRLAIPAPDGAKTLAEALRRLDAADVELLDIALRRPSLDEVFLHLTGHPAEVAVDSEVPA